MCTVMAFQAQYNDFCKNYQVPTSTYHPTPHTPTPSDTTPQDNINWNTTLFINFQDLETGETSWIAYCDDSEHFCQNSSVVKQYYHFHQMKKDRMENDFTIEVPHRLFNSLKLMLFSMQPGKGKLWDHSFPLEDMLEVADFFVIDELSFLKHLMKLKTSTPLALLPVIYRAVQLNFLAIAQQICDNIGINFLPILQNRCYEDYDSFLETICHKVKCKISKIA